MQTASSWSAHNWSLFLLDSQPAARTEERWLIKFTSSNIIPPNLVLFQPRCYEMRGNAHTLSSSVPFTHSFSCVKHLPSSRFTTTLWLHSRNCISYSICLTDVILKLTKSAIWVFFFLIDSSCDCMCICMRERKCIYIYLCLSHGLF